MSLRRFSVSGIDEEQQAVADRSGQFDVLSIVSLAANGKAPDLPPERLVQRAHIGRT